MVRARVFDERKDRILEAAEEVIGAAGLAKLNMTAIGKAAELSRSAVYQYFDSKEHVLGELILNDMADLANELDKIVAITNDPTRQLVLWVNHTLQYLVSPGHEILKQVSLEQLPENYRGLIRGMHGQFMLSLLSPLQRLSPEDPQAIAAFVYSSVTGAAKRIEEGGDYDSEAAALERFIVAGVIG